MEQQVIGVIGLGYVGLPLAIEFSKKFPVIGFDINQKRVNALLAGNDFTLEVSNEDLTSVLKTSKDTGNGIIILLS
jgi:UDP-N-acetyl-D-galactosamine dehydrogenase